MGNHGVVVMVVDKGRASCHYSETKYEPLILDLDVYSNGALHEASCHIEEVLILPIDTIHRMELVELIFANMGYDSEYCLRAFNDAAEELNLPFLDGENELREWKGWTLIEYQRSDQGLFVQPSRLKEPNPDANTVKH